MSLGSRLDRWVAEGLLEAEASERILAWEAARRSPWGLQAVAALGGLAMVLGLVALVGANWEAIGRTAKVGVDLVLGVALAVGTLRARVDWGREVLRLLLSGWVLGSIALVGQQYQLGGHAADGLLLWLLLTLPLLAGTDWRITGGLLAGAVTVTVIGLLERWDSALSGEQTALLASASATLLCAAGALLQRRGSALGPGFLTVGGAQVGLALLAAPLAWYDGQEARPLVIGWSACAAVLAWVFATSPRWQDDAQGRLGAGALPVVTWASVVLAVGADADGSSLLSTATSIGLWGLAAWVAARAGWTGLAAALTAFIALRLLVLYLELAGSLLDTGLLLLSGGALTLALAWGWRRGFRLLRVSE